MKKLIVFLFILASILSACLSPSGGTPQVTVTLTPLHTEIPIPTPTLHPQFVEIQEQIAASGERFTLQADGTILDGTEPIPGLIVTADGTMALTVDGESMTLDPANVDFDDENGISIKYWVDGVEDGDKLNVITEDSKRWTWDSDLGWVEIEETVLGCMTAAEAVKSCVLDPEFVLDNKASEIFDLSQVTFPETAYNSGRIYIEETKGGKNKHLAWAWGSEGGDDDKDYRREPEVYAPYMWVPNSWYSFVKDGVTYVGRVQAWLDPDGDIHFLKYVVKYIPETQKALRVWDEMAVGWPVFDHTDEDIQFSIEAGNTVIAEIKADDEMDLLIYQWKDTGEIPDGLEEKNLLPFIADTEWYMPLK